MNTRKVIKVSSISYNHYMALWQAGYVIIFTGPATILE